LPCRRRCAGANSGCHELPQVGVVGGGVGGGEEVSPRSRCSPALSEVRAMKLKWGKLGKRGRRSCTDCPASKTNKNLR
jgi:hypothetical protein